MKNPRERFEFRIKKSSTHVLPRHFSQIHTLFTTNAFTITETKLALATIQTPSLHVACRRQCAWQCAQAAVRMALREPPKANEAASVRCVSFSRTRDAAL